MSGQEMCHNEQKSNCILISICANIVPLNVTVTEFTHDDRCPITLYSVSDCWLFHTTI